MKNTLIALALVLVVMFTVGAQQPKTQWEYKFVKECHEKKANSIANEGWELQQIGMSGSGITTYITCVFKRPKP